MDFNLVATKIIYYKNLRLNHKKDIKDDRITGKWQNITNGVSNYFLMV